MYEYRPGRWRAQVTVGAERESLGVYDTEELARAVVDAYVERLGDVSTGNVLRVYAEKWFERRERSGRVKHVKVERSRWRTHVDTAPFSVIPMRSIKRRHVAQWVRGLLEQPAIDTITVGRGANRHTIRRPTGRTLARNGIVSTLSLLRCCLRDACDDGLLDANPAADVRVPRDVPRDPAWTWLTAGELAAVLGCEAVPLDRRHLFAVAAYTGLRASELWHLRWERVHLDGDRPRVEVRAPAKSQAAIRDVPLLPEAREALAALRELGGVRRMTGLVWPRDDGAPHREWDGGWSEHREYRGEGEARELHVRPSVPTVAGVERRVRFHDLRHTAASHLVQGTWTTRPLRLEEVRQWLGHTSIVTTQRYAHLSPDGLAAAVPHTFRTPAHGASPKSSESVGRAGLEPATVGLKGRCPDE